MTLFIDLRATPSGGICAQAATVWDDRTILDPATSQFASRVGGLDVVIATHGFNVDRDKGIEHLSLWSTRCQLSASGLFVGVLWPGDSRFFPIIDYPFEGDEAIASGRLLASFLNHAAVDAASISFVSHSLGARTVLEALKKLERKARRLILMAAAVEDDCLAKEYQLAAKNVEEIYVISSRKDSVLEFAFPIGNPIGEIIMHGHPYFKTALGREGPMPPIPLEQRGGAWRIPDGWDYGHGDYLPEKAIGRAFALPITAPRADEDVPSHPPRDIWRPSWSAAVVATQVL